MRKISVLVSEGSVLPLIELYSGAVVPLDSNGQGNRILSKLRRKKARPFLRNRICAI